MIFAASGMRMTPAAAGTCLRAEQRIEKIAVRSIARAGAAELKARVPIRRRLELLSGAIVFAELIIGRALFGALEHLISLADFLEACLGILLFADVRMIFAGKLAVGLLDLRVSRIARHAHHVVIILEFHRSPGISRRGRILRANLR